MNSNCNDLIRLIYKREYVTNSVIETFTKYKKVLTWRGKGGKKRVN